METEEEVVATPAGGVAVVATEAGDADEGADVGDAAPGADAEDATGAAADEDAAEGDAAVEADAVEADARPVEDAAGPAVVEEGPPACPAAVGPVLDVLPGAGAAAEPADATPFEVDGAALGSSGLSTPTWPDFSGTFASDFSPTCSPDFASDSPTASA